MAYSASFRKHTARHGIARSGLALACGTFIAGCPFRGDDIGIAPDCCFDSGFFGDTASEGPQCTPLLDAIDPDARGTLPAWATVRVGIGAPVDTTLSVDGRDARWELVARGTPSRPMWLAVPSQPWPGTGVTFRVLAPPPQAVSDLCTIETSWRYAVIPAPAVAPDDGPWFLGEGALTHPDGRLLSAILDRTADDGRALGVDRTQTTLTLTTHARRSGLPAHDDDPSDDLVIDTEPAPPGLTRARADRVDLGPVVVHDAEVDLTQDGSGARIARLRGILDLQGVDDTLQTEMCGAPAADAGLACEPCLDAPEAVACLPIDARHLPLAPR